MHERSRTFAIESITVMLVMVLFALVTFLMIDAGADAYGGIIDDKETTQNARTAYSYINMKVKQNDAAGCISVVQTKFGDTLQIDSGAYSTYIFYAEGGLYECLTLPDAAPSVDAANRIAALGGFALEQNGALMTVTCVLQDGSALEGTVALRS